MRVFAVPKVLHVFAELRGQLDGTAVVAIYETFHKVPVAMKLGVKMSKLATTTPASEVRT